MWQSMLAKNGFEIKRKGYLQIWVSIYVALKCPCTQLSSRISLLTNIPESWEPHKMFNSRSGLVSAPWFENNIQVTVMIRLTALTNTPSNQLSFLTRRIFKLARSLYASSTFDWADCYHSSWSETYQNRLGGTILLESSSKISHQASLGDW